VDLPRVADLLLDFHGSEASVVEQAKAVQEIARDNGGSTSSGRRGRRTAASSGSRHHAYFACLQLKPGARALSTDVCVPISRLAECVTRRQGHREILAADPPLRHVGDALPPGDPDRPENEEIEEAKALQRCAWCGARSLWKAPHREHGVGIGKQATWRGAAGP